MPRKKGFWIKKDGYIAVDLSMNTKDTNFAKKIKKRRPVLNSRGKSTHQKKEIMRELRQRIKQEEIKKNFHIRQKGLIEAKANKLVDIIKARYKKQRTEDKKEVLKTVYKKAGTLAKALVAAKVVPLQKSQLCVFHSAMGFWFINEFLDREEMDYRTFFYIIQISFYNLFFFTDTQSWPMMNSYVTRRVHLMKLVKDGYIEPFMAQRGAYVLSLKGRDVVNRYQAEYKSYIDKTLIIKKDGTFQAKRPPKQNLRKNRIPKTTR